MLSTFRDVGSTFSGSDKSGFRTNGRTTTSLSFDFYPPRIWSVSLYFHSCPQHEFHAYSDIKRCCCWWWWWCQLSTVPWSDGFSRLLFCARVFSSLMQIWWRGPPSLSVYDSSFVSIRQVWFILPSDRYITVAMFPVFFSRKREKKRNPSFKNVYTFSLSLSLALFFFFLLVELDHISASQGYIYSL